jgi:hypothetical protein
MPVGFYKDKVQANTFIKDLARQGQFSKQEITLKVFEKFGFGKKFVEEIINSNCNAGVFIQIEGKIQNFMIWEARQQEKEIKLQEAQKKEMEELDDIFKGKAEKS